MKMPGTGPGHRIQWIPLTSMFGVISIGRQSKCPLWNIIPLAQPNANTWIGWLCWFKTKLTGLRMQLLNHGIIHGYLILANRPTFMCGATSIGLARSCLHLHTLCPAQLSSNTCMGHNQGCCRAWIIGKSTNPLTNNLGTGLGYQTPMILHTSMCGAINGTLQNSKPVSSTQCLVQQNTSTWIKEPVDYHVLKNSDTI